MTPCEPNPCGPNAICKEQNGVGSCSCTSNYFGNPYDGCRPECITNSDCSSNLACINMKCIDSCPGTCGKNAVCQVINHNSVCSCNVDYTGDPFRYCSLIEKGIFCTLYTMNLFVIFLLHYFLRFCRTN
jgi:hypothetical protein